MKRSVLAALATGLLVSCHQPVEYSETAQSGVVKLRVSDNSIVGSTGNIPEGRALCSLGNTEFLVVSGSGVLYRFDSETMIPDTAFTIGSSSGSGYGSIITPTTASAYTIGSAGKLIEIDLTANSVADEFSAGPFPNALCTSSSSQRIYVTDGSDQKVREIDTGTNTVLRETAELCAVPVAIVAESYLDQYLLVSCSDEDGTVERISIATFYSSPSYLGQAGSDLTAFPAESVWAVVHPEWYGENGRVSICSSFSIPEVSTQTIEGHPTDICGIPGTTLCYILSYLGAGTSRITSINWFTGDVIGSVDIPGFPWDMTSHANGEFVLILTSDV
jgi:DNA-binding beta-propeller fold protein YncE